MGEFPSRSGLFLRKYNTGFTKLRRVCYTKKIRRFFADSPVESRKQKG